VARGGETRLSLERDWVEQGQPWGDKAYQALRTTIESVAPGLLRDNALGRIQTLGCFRSAETPPASFDPSAPVPPEAEPWRKALEAASVKDTHYAVALAKALKSLVCSSDKDAIHVVRSGGFELLPGGFRFRLQAAGTATSDLIDDLTSKESKDCPVAASVTDADRAKLLQVKQAAVKKPEH
jgi:hypothetical protein